MQVGKLVLFSFSVMLLGATSFGRAAALQQNREAVPSSGGFVNDDESMAAQGSKSLHADFNADGLQDLFTISPAGRGQLLLNLSGGRYEDKTPSFGLTEVQGLVGGLSHDMDADGYEDLILVYHDGRMRLLVGSGQALEDSSAALGLTVSGTLRTLRLQDRDLNGWADVVAVSSDEQMGAVISVAFNYGALQFEVRTGTGKMSESLLAEVTSLGQEENSAVCSDDLIDQAGGACIEASSVATLGKLYPIGPDLFVDPVFGRVGVGVTDPTQALDVDGVIRSRAGGIQFPDGTIQTTKSLQGPAGLPGPQGFQGEAGATGPTGLAPAGAIVMWSGSLASVPSGWALCDGTSGTPDLRDRFVLGVGVGQEPGELGGSHQLQLSLLNMPAHDHTFLTDSSGSHAHGYNDCSYDHTIVNFVLGFTGIWVSTGGVSCPTLSTSTDGAHTHSGTTDSSGQTQAFDNRPAYYRLAFIMKL